MKRIHFLNLIFVIVEVVAFVPLTSEVFGNMNVDIITISAIVLGIGMIGNCVCSIVRAVKKR